MGDIVLKKNNVVKRVDSKDKALALEMKGFVRNDGKSTKKSTDNAANEDVINGLKAQLVEANKKITYLEAELSGTKEQLEAAVKKNKAADKK